MTKITTPEQPAAADPAGDAGRGKKNIYDNTSSRRQGAHLDKLASGGGKPVRVDTAGDDLKLMQDLIKVGYAPNNAEVYRRSMREAHKRAGKKLQQLAERSENSEQH